MASTRYDYWQRKSDRKAWYMPNKIYVKQIWSHGLVNYKDAKSKFSLLYWWEGVSGC
jgi:hypothetical protein